MIDRNKVYRIFVFLAGVWVTAFGISFITKSALGTSQISAVPYILSLRSPALSFGTFTFIMNLFLILGQ